MVKMTSSLIALISTIIAALPAASATPLGVPPEMIPKPTELSTRVQSESNIYLTNLGSGTCLDLPSETKADKGNITGWKCHGGPSQIWRIHEVGMHGPWHKYMMQNTASQTFMDLAWGKNEWGTDIWGWNGDTEVGADNDHQLWHFESADPYDRNIVWIKNSKTKLVVELVGGNAENGTRIEGDFLRPIEDNRKEQMWKITVVG